MKIQDFRMVHDVGLSLGIYFIFIFHFSYIEHDANAAVIRRAKNQATISIGDTPRTGNWEKDNQKK